MASLSLPMNSNLQALHSPTPRHARKHSRHPTAAAPLPSFLFNADSLAPGETQDENLQPGKTPSAPATLPAFSFNPGANIPVARTPSPTHPILEEMQANQQRVSRSARPAPLPAFTFKPSQEKESDPGSPSKSEIQEPSKHIGAHKRAGSEFVGGVGENTQTAATSPVRHTRIGPPTEARRHTHRRSQAISISDIDTSDLIKQHAVARSKLNSNPSTPSDPNDLSFPRATPRQSPALVPTLLPGSPAKRRESAPGSRPRVVDFSDKVDVIPRPLSMISSETERSNSTIRGHSVTGSINSIASLPLSSPMSVSVIIDSPPSAALQTKRPNTADAALTLSSGRQDEEYALHLPKRPLSASASPMVSASGSPPLKKKHFWSSREPSPTPTPTTEAVDPFTDLKVVIPEFERSEETAERPSMKKRRKYHTWTEGLFSKKTKPKVAKRMPSPPQLKRRDSDRLQEIFDTDDTVVLREDSPVDVRKQPQITRFLAPPSRDLQTETTSPTIDIDAALSPFDDSRNDNERVSDDGYRSVHSKRRSQLHSSAQSKSTVDAFGTVHRRTESAPSMSPVNRTLFGFSRHGSTADLEDVFEAEEDSFLAHEKENSTIPPVPAISTIHSPKGGLGLTNVSNYADKVMIVDHESESERKDPRSSDSTLEAPVLAAEDVPKRPSTSPMSFTYPDLSTHYASSMEAPTTSASLISSPDPDHISFDTNTRPKRFGEWTTDVMRPSTDDIPSLSDSVCSSAAPKASEASRTRPSLEQRSHSMFVPGSHGRPQSAWKRSSLASFHRLIPGSAHSSRLRLESGAENLDETPVHKKTKSNRLSRVLSFWRSKEMKE